jgi:shikimate dehydrogenase
MYQLGLIGKGLSHSFSKKYFEKKFNRLGIASSYKYDLFNLDDVSEVVHLVVDHPNLIGLNVTLPYKESIIDYCDEVSDGVKKVGAANTLSIVDGNIYGYNTDIIGFEKSFVEFFVKETNITKALVLGNGGASKAIQYVLNKYHIKQKVIIRKGEFNYDNWEKELVETSQLIINTTPVGMYPKMDEVVRIPYEFINESHYLIDLIYNPLESNFLKLGKERGAKTMNGLNMLHYQADASWDIWQQSLNN